MTLEFLDLDEPPPEEGQRLDLRVANPSYEVEMADYRAALERNPFAENDVCETSAPRLVDPPDALMAPDELCIPHRAVTFVVGYPFAGQYAVTVVASTPAGFTRAELFRQLVRVYSAMYADAALSSVPHLHNMRVESSRFGTAWHRLDDLIVEEILLQTRADGTVFAWVSLGS